MFACGTQYVNINPFYRKLPPRLDDDVRVAGDGFLVRGIVGTRYLRVLLIWTVIDEGSDLDPIDQPGNPTDVVTVIVRDQDIVDLLQASLMRRGKNTIGVAAFIPRPACVDQQRLARRAHDERGLSAFYVDEVNLHGLGGGSGGPKTVGPHNGRSAENCD